MNRALTILFAALLCLTVAGYANAAQQEVHYEGYTMGSNPSAAGTQLNGRGLVTAIFPPLIAFFAGNEYTWVMEGLFSNGSVLADSVYTTTYSGGQYTIWEDACQDARPTFYQCPAPINGLDVRYANRCFQAAPYYLRGHFVSYKSTFNTHAASFGEGTFVATLNWDSGSNIGQLDPGLRGAWTFGGTTVSQFACIPVTADPVLGPYQQAMTGVITQLTTKVQETSWGTLRHLYK